MNIKVHQRLVFKLTTTILLFLLLFSYINWDEFILTLKNANIMIISILILIWFFTLPIKSARWNVILRGYGIKESQLQTFFLYWAGSFFNNFFPSSVGGDSYKFLIMNNLWPNRKATLVSSMVLERFIGICTLIPFPIILGWPLLGIISNFEMIYFGYCLIVSFFLFCAATGLVAIQRFGYKILSESRFMVLQKLGFLLGIFLSYRDCRGLAFAILISLMLYILSCFFYQLCFLAYGQQMTLVPIMIIVPMLAVATAVPISINGLGVTEGLSVFLFSLFGISFEVALAVSLTARVLLIIASTSGGFVYLVYKPSHATTKPSKPSKLAL